MGKVVQRYQEEKYLKMKLNKLYKYPPSTRSTTDGLRTYAVGKEKLPSVTTILQATQSPEKLEFFKNWRAQKGAEESYRIKNEAASRGTNLHKHLEKYILGEGHADLTEEGKLAKAMSDVIIDQAVKDLSEVVLPKDLITLGARRSGKF